MHLSLWRPAILAVSLLAGGAGAIAQTVNFEAQCPGGSQGSGPCSSLFKNAGNAQAVTVSTSIGNVTFQGGGLLDDATNLPADETAVYGTASPNFIPGIGTGFNNPITITFPSNIHNFYLTLLNGNTSNVNYLVADNAGNSATFSLIPNLSSGSSLVGFAASGNVVTITALNGTSAETLNWDFFIDNVNFNTALPNGLNPISTTTAPGSGTAQAPAISPLSGALLVLGLGVIGWLSLRPKAKTGAPLAILALLLIPAALHSADGVMSVKGVWKLSFNQGAVTVTIDRQTGNQFTGTIAGDRLGGRISGTVQGMTLVFDRTPASGAWPADDTGLQRQSFKLQLTPSCGGCAMVAHGGWNGYGQTSASRTAAGLAASIERVR